MMQDLTGKQFGNWVVLEYNGRSEWLCECQCEKHTKRLIRTYMLKSGQSKSCGCGRVTSQVIDLTNQMFGNWKVLEYAGSSKWLCECQCKNHTQKIVAGRDLKSGSTLSCGCLVRKDGKPYGSEFSSINKKKSHLKEDLTGRRFGNWLVKKYIGNYKWECECQCENKTIRNVSRYDLINGRSTNCGCNRHKDLSGMTFGRLHVKRYLGNMIWECECQCDNHSIVNVLTCNLVNGGTQSCGCIKNESRNTKEEYLNAINTYMNKYGDKPYIDDVAKMINIHRDNARKNIQKYNLTDYINKSFGSHYEHDIFNYCNQFGYKVISRDRTVISPQELDIYIPEKKIAIEFNGNYWHSNDRLQDKFYHQNKTIACAKQGIRLIHIFEYEWDDIDKQSKILKMLNRLLSNNTKTIYGRNTNIEQIYDEDVVRTFLNKYHIQGYSKASINLGCYSDKTNELLGIMTFGTPRFNNNYQYELIRFCWKDKIAVVGGAEKLFKYFCDTYNPDSVITYSDLSKFTGNVYTRISFKPIQPKPITEPNYVWLNETTDLVFTRYQAQKQKLIKSGLGTTEQTETEIMQNNGFIQIFDCGNIKLEYLKN